MPDSVAPESKRHRRREALRAAVENDLRLALRPLLVEFWPDPGAVEAATERALSGIRRRYPGWRLMGHVDCWTKRVGVELEPMPDDARRAEIARRWRAGEAVAHLLDADQRAADAAFRAWLGDQGPPGVDALRRLDARIRDVENGVYAARMAWHSSSPAQRRVLLFLAPGRVLVRSVRVAGYYDAAPLAAGLSTVAKAARLDTVRNLAARGLVAWDGGIPDPEARAVFTERGRFVVAHAGEAR